MAPNLADSHMRDVDSPEWFDLYEEEVSRASIERFDATGERIGPYRVLRSLGQGGMGEVFLAERADEQFQQRVAIKLVRRELLSKQVQSRLRLERQILASLEHPNIARLLDGGSTKDGIPYIVMEYIDGDPIDVYCDQHRLTINQRLELFRSVCDAVHSAHQNLIVHRDLKPSNILVTAGGVPKLLDFGIAKMLDARRMTQTVALTEADFRMLTPDHASPEQLIGDLITTASDTYVLGVLLYELLTGCKPFTLKGRSFADLERTICEEPPVPPSEVFSARSPESRQQLEDIAASRSTTLAKLKREVEGDLTSIILMALRKEPERRYPSVRQFSEDIGNYLQGLPVNARLDTWAYRSIKFIKRHALVVSMAAMLALTLLGTTAFMYLNSLELERQRDDARAERQRADKQSATATATVRFLINLFEALDPENARGKAPTILEYLESAPQRIRSELASQPEVQATFLNTIGQVYMRLGKLDRALPLLEEAWDIFQSLKIETPVVADVALNLAEVYARDDPAKAEQFLAQTIAISRRVEGPESRGIARGLCGQGILLVQRNQIVDAQQRLRQCIAMYEALSNIDPSEMAIALDQLALTAVFTGNLAEAESLWRRWLSSNQAIAPDSPRFLEQQQNLATVLQMQGKPQEAVELYKKVIAANRKVLPDSKPLADVLTNYGWALQELQRFEEAERSFKEAQSINAQLPTTTDNDRTYLLARMAGLELDRGNPSRAESMFRESLSMLSKLGTTRYRPFVLTGLSKTLVSRSRPEGAVQHIHEALPLLEETPGRNSYQYGLAQGILGRALWQQGLHEQAQPLLREAYAKYTAQRGFNVPDARLLRSWLDEASNPVGAR
jgi:eukaryotic-like serine/threonine-protein kinase